MAASRHQSGPNADTHGHGRPAAPHAISKDVRDVPVQLGMCAFYRVDQFPSGAFAYAENIMRGFAALCRASTAQRPFEFTVFHRTTGLRWTDESLTYCPIPSI